MTNVFERMIRQYKYLEKSLDDEMKKVAKNILSVLSNSDYLFVAVLLFLVKNNLKNLTVV